MVYRIGRGLLLTITLMWWRLDFASICCCQYKFVDIVWSKDMLVILFFQWQSSSLDTNFQRRFRRISLLFANDFSSPCFMSTSFYYFCYVYLTNNDCFSSSVMMGLLITHMGSARFSTSLLSPCQLLLYLISTQAGPAVWLFHEATYGASVVRVLIRVIFRRLYWHELVVPVISFSVREILWIATVFNAVGAQPIYFHWWSHVAR